MRVQEREREGINIVGTGAVGVDTEGHKRVLGLKSERRRTVRPAGIAAESGRAQSGSRTEQLFAIDGSTALRSVIHAVFGAQAPVQRCRQHRLQNVVERLPRE